MKLKGYGETIKRKIINITYVGKRGKTKNKMLDEGVMIYLENSNVEIVFDDKEVKNLRKSICDGKR